VPALWTLLAWTRRESELQVSAPANGASAARTSFAVAVLAPRAAVGTPTTTQVGWVTGTGINPPGRFNNNTPGPLNIYGTDLGLIWDHGTADNSGTSVDEHQVLIAFGDTFGPNSQNWRSNVLLRSSDSLLADGI